MIRTRLRPASREVVRLEPLGFDVAVKRSARSRRLTLRLAAATRELSVTVPLYTPLDEIREFVRAQEAWIVERHAAMPQPIPMLPGERLPIRDARLILASGTGRRVRREGETLLIPGTGVAFSNRLRAWVKEQARQAALEACDRYAAALGRSYGRLTLRDPRSRWGSCSSEGNVMLSWRLVLAPSTVLDYVAAHEIAHLAEMNHSPAFWEHVTRLMPEADEPRAWLKTHGASLHRFQF